MGAGNFCRGAVPSRLGGVRPAALKSRPITKAAIAETGAASLKDMGKVMAVLKERYSGSLDFGKAGALIKAQLSAK